MLSNWSHTAIAGKPVDVFAEPGSLPFALLFLHACDEQSPATSPAFTAALRAHRLRCVAPHGGECWWADRVCEPFDAEITPERYLRESLVPWMRTEWQLSARAIAVAGVEMGGQGALRLGFKHPDEFPIVASISGALDCQEWYGRGTPLDEMYDTRERCRQDTAILHLDGYRWPPHIWFACEPTDALSYRGNDRLSEKLTAMGVPHTSDLDTRAPAGADYTEQMTAPMMAFLAAALARESKRLA